MIRWMRSRKQLLDELVEARELCVTLTAELAANAETLREELGKAAGTIATLQAELSQALQDRGAMRVERDVARHHLDDRLVKATAGDRAIESRPLPAGGELLRERARADTLAERLQQLQEANMAAGRMHDFPGQEPVSS